MIMQQNYKAQSSSTSTKNIDHWMDKGIAIVNYVLDYIT